MERNNYLINRFLKHYLIASIATVAIANLNTAIDGILMGNFLGPDALAAINLVMPVQTTIMAICMMLSGGASLIIGKALGEMDYEKVKKSFTACTTALLLAGGLLLPVGLCFSGEITFLLCGEDALGMLVESYLKVSICTAFVTMIESGLGQLIDAAGQPRMVTKAMVLSVVVNIFCDVLYVYVLRGGIGSAAFATATGYLASILYMTSYLKHPDCPYGFSWHELKLFGRIKEIVLNGLPIMLLQLSTALLFFMINYFVYKAQGADGTFVMAIGVTMITASFTVANGVAMSFLSIGAMLAGQEDWRGVGMLFKSSFKLVGISVAIFMVFGIGFSKPIAVVFGADTASLLEMAGLGLPLSMCFLPGICASQLMGIVYQVISCNGVAQVVSLSSLTSLFISFLICSKAFLPEYIWCAFPMASFIILVLILLLSEITRRRKREERMFITLLPKVKQEHKVLDISVPCHEHGIKKSMGEIHSFSHAQCPPEVEDKLCTCISEILTNVVQHGGVNSGHYIDVKLVNDDHIITASIRDDGKKFDPTDCPEEQRKNGLKQLYSNCSQLSYRYSFGQNMLVLQWQTGSVPLYSNLP